MEQEADILLTSEGSLSGYTPKFDASAVEVVLRRVTEKAREAEVALALGTCFIEAEDEKCYNEIRFYEADGEYLGFHSKTLTCGSLTDPPKGEINDYAVSPLRTFDFHGITIGRGKAAAHGGWRIDDTGIVEALVVVERVSRALCRAGRE